MDLTVFLITVLHEHAPAVLYALIGVVAVVVLAMRVTNNRRPHSAHPTPVGPFTLMWCQGCDGMFWAAKMMFDWIGLYRCPKCTQARADQFTR